ncbi:type VII secretion protein EccB [Solwaraspora sp. WMMD406]|uniref:type VII secretion protein EccB n=1 Tax=Solwaraspora sp. WMMD406 TaxID=3016095 RepID=UPI0024173A94|nr:type VII secretion protein EccB [Solwaraspora sp. WMMD406]MDG4765074.1 type VII secretion protein EccB [Solwaraspora sp. WMMD406]
MYARRDQVQAQAYVNRRLILAVLTADPDAPEVPTQRTTFGMIAGSVIMGLIVAGFAVFGLIVPGGSTAWREPGALVLEKETGATYLYVDGTLHPVRNHTSARLLLGGEPNLVSVSRRSLDGTPHGPALGLPDAPESLPDPDALNHGPWSVCAGFRLDDTGVVTPLVSLIVAELPDTTEVADDSAVLARAPDDSWYVIWRGTRLKVTRPWIPTALGLDPATALPVAASWLNAVPAGPDLAPPAVPGRGGAGRQLDGDQTRIGQLFAVRDVAGDQTYYLLRADGLVQLSDLDAALVLADPDTAAAYPDGPVVARPLSAATPAGALAPVTAGTGGDRPTALPRQVTVGAGQAACVLATPATEGAQAELVLAAAAATTAAPVVAPAGSPADGRLADRVRVAGSSGALIRPVVAPDVPGIAYFLVTDEGIKYPIPSQAVLLALGYDASDAVAMAPQLLSLLPTGPALDLAPIVG